jgi:hypothetical protein
MLHRMLLLSLLVVCAGCSVQPKLEPASPSDAGVLEVRPAGNRTFMWQGQTYSVQELEVALAARHRVAPITRINILAGDVPMTVADAIDVGMAVKTTGASIFVESDGQLRRFTFSIDK